MIPSDLAARLRMLAEASFFDSEPPVQGTAKVREIQARLPQLMPGQQFTAHLQRALPDGTFQAVVAGRSYTLALNHAAKAGDTLELVVTQNTPRAVFAQVAAPPGSAPADASRPNLSPTARLISFLLTGQPAPQAANLAAGKPLLNAPPASGAGAAALVPVLRQAVSQSGLFYESHQLQWLSGKVEAASLMREPQGQHALPRLPGLPGAGPGTGTGVGAGAGAGTTSGLAPLAQGTLGDPGASQAARTGLPPGQGGSQPGTPGATTPRSTLAGMTGAGGPDAMEGRVDRAADPNQPAATVRATAVPDRLVPIVHQQLDAMASQNYVLHGQAWPGQTFEWEIEDPEGERQGEEGEGATWNTTLRLRMPRLGGIEARIQLTPAGVALRLVADEAGTRDALDTARDRLDMALAAADVPLTGFVTEHRDEH